MNELSDHLFRQESGRMVAALTRLFGVHNFALAEDVVQDAFCRAMEVWKFRGVPDNPAAWLMTTAKNKALDVLRRERTARTFAPELGRLLESEWTLAPVVEEFFGAQSIQDDMLRMMFSCCHPRLSEDVQIALILNVLCGFSAGEVAGAFVSGLAAMEKRITRGKKALASAKRLFDLADGEVQERLTAVQRALYLLFNEGYHGASPESAVRADLCREALRLTRLLTQHPLTATPSTLALSALMCLHAARLDERTDASGQLKSLFEQDRSRWNAALIAEGQHFLELSATGAELSEYHLEAGIAAVHAHASSPESTDWGAIISLYDTLLTFRPSPVIALSRAVAVAQRDGPERGIEQIHAIAQTERLASYPFLAAALGELELRLHHTAAAAEHFRQARKLARNPMERKFFSQRLAFADEQSLQRP